MLKLELLQLINLTIANVELNTVAKMLIIQL